MAPPKNTLVSRRSVRIARGFAGMCLAIALAGCHEAVPPPAVSFITQKPMIDISALVEGVAMSSLTLPAAVGGSGELTYSLKPEVPGLTFTGATRVLSGTPTAAGSYSMTYTATDTRGATASLNFAIAVQAAPPPFTIDPAPKAADVASGTYLTAVLGGDDNDALTVDGAASLPDSVFTDAEVTALLGADWYRPFVELAAANPKVIALLAALVPAYDTHIPATAFTVRIREGVTPIPNERFIPPIALGSFSVGAGTVAAIAMQPSADQTESCYLTTSEAEALLGSGDPALARRVATCAGSSAHTGLSTMQAVEVARACGNDGCRGVAGRQRLAAVGATVLHRLVVGTAAELSNMVLANWFIGTWFGHASSDDDDDGIGELEEYAVMRIGVSSAEFICCHHEDGQEVEIELGPWSHRQTRAGGEFYSGGSVLQYGYITDPLLAIHGGSAGHDWWLARVGPEVVGAWSGSSDTDTYELSIGTEGYVALTTSGVTMNGFVEHEQNFMHEEDNWIDIIFDQSGYPVLNFCGDLRMAFPDSSEVQNWRYCIEGEDRNMMYVDIPPFDPDEEWIWDLVLTR